MPNYSTYGVVLADLSKYGHRIEADASSSPTADQVVELIAARSAEWHNVLLSVGADPASIAADSDLAVYSLGKEWITRAVAGDVLLARTRSPSELTLLLGEQSKARLREIEERVARLGDGAAVGVNAANAAHNDVERATQVAAVRATQSLGARLAYSGGL